MDWTTVAVALLSGGSGVLGGYLGAGRQASGALDGLREQHRERTRRDLQQTYHQTLDHLTILNSVYGGYGGYAPFEDVNDFDAWVQQFHHLANGIRLLGSQEAIDSVINMSAELGLAYALLPDEDDYGEEDFPPLDDQLRTALSTGEEKWFEQFRDFVQTVRNDVNATTASTSRRWQELR